MVPLCSHTLAIGVQCSRKMNGKRLGLWGPLPNPLCNKKTLVVLLVFMEAKPTKTRSTP